MTPRASDYAGLLLLAACHGLPVEATMRLSVTFKLSSARVVGQSLMSACVAGFPVAVKRRAAGVMGGIAFLGAATTFARSLCQCAP